MAENLITQAELESYAPDLDLTQYNATTISGMINRASKRLAKMAGVEGFFTASVSAETDRARINASGELIISFRRRPVAQGGVSAIALKTVDVNQDLTLQSGGSDIYFIPAGGRYLIYPSNYLISHGTGLISLRNANLLYEVSYTGGYATDIADIPSDLKEATTLMIRDSQYNPAGLKSFSQGSYSETRSADGSTPFSTKAREILEDGDYVRMVV